MKQNVKAIAGVDGIGQAESSSASVGYAILAGLGLSALSLFVAMRLVKR